MRYKFSVKMKPKAKARPRFSRKGYAYTPQNQHEWERKFASYYEGPCYDEPVQVKIRFHVDHIEFDIQPVDHGNNLRGDLDNYSKSCLDALNGIAFTDDRLVHKLTTEKV